jgi:phage terminase small subunit
MKDLNGAQAAIRSGYSSNCAKEIASENLTKPNVQAAIEKEKQKVAKRAAITVDEIVQNLKMQLRVNSQRVPKTNFQGEQITDENGNPVFQLLDPANAKGVADLLMKHVGGYDADHHAQEDHTLEIRWGNAQEAQKEDDD